MMLAVLRAARKLGAVSVARGQWGVWGEEVYGGALAEAILLLWDTSLADAVD